VIVGRSMGGAIALSVAARHPGVPAAIIMLDGAVLTPPALLALADQFGAAFRSPAYLDAVTGVLGQMFMASDDAARRARIVEQMTSTPQHVLASAWDAIWKNDFAGDAALCRVPALYVGSPPVADMPRLREPVPRSSRRPRAQATSTSSSAGPGERDDRALPQLNQRWRRATDVVVATLRSMRA
jgi:pimeloyl-ACP methyl ester carboxylesterase